MEIRTAIIGYGLAGRIFHEPLIRAVEGLDLVAVATSRRDQVPEGIAVGSPDELIADPNIQLIVIASPNQSHFRLADSALKAGKNVVIDKPMCVTAREAEQLIETAKHSARLLTVFHNRRWDSDFLTVSNLLSSNALGEIKLFEAHWDRFRPEVAERWREKAEPGSGLLYDLGPHLIDQALLLFGPPQAMGADAAAQRDGAEVDDYFALTLHYGSSRVILSASSLIAQPRPRFSIHGTSGSFVMFGIDPQEDQLRAGGDALAPDFGLDSSLHGTLTAADGSSTRVPSQGGEWPSFYRGVVAAIADGAPPPVAPEDALMGLRIIEAALQSVDRRVPICSVEEAL